MNRPTEGWGSNEAYEVIRRHSAASIEAGVYLSYNQHLRDLEYRLGQTALTGIRRALSVELPLIPHWKKADDPIELDIAKVDPDSGKILQYSQVTVCTQEDGDFYARKFFDMDQIKVLLDQVVELQDIGITPSGYIP